jgi:hypothetical protein
MHLLELTGIKLDLKQGSFWDKIMVMNGLRGYGALENCSEVCLQDTLDSLTHTAV